ncbi:MAG: tetratricopeptide repeat protein [Pyrinomonadaceae bacterium]
MAKRKSRLQAGELPINDKPKEPVLYKDTFQRESEKRIDNFSRKFAGKGKTILYALAAIVVLAALIGIVYSWNRRSNGAAQAALGQAIETSQAPVTTLPVPAGSTVKTFPTEKARAEAAVAEFQAVAEKYGAVRDKANYFAAVNRLTLDRQAAEQQLADLAKTSGEVGSLSKFALAQAKQDDGNLDEAASLYNELAQSGDPVISKTTINFALAAIYEKQGKTADAVNLYYDIAKSASELKDLDGKPVPPSPTAQEAKEKLQNLDPSKAAEIKEAPPSLPEGM